MPSLIFAGGVVIVVTQKPLYQARLLWDLLLREVIAANGDKEGAEGLGRGAGNLAEGVGVGGNNSGTLGTIEPPEVNEVVGVQRFCCLCLQRRDPRLLGLDYESRSSGGTTAELEPLSGPGLGGLPGDGVGVQGVPVSGVSVLREEGVPERGALRRRAGPSSTWPTRSANLSEHTVSPRSSGRVEI